MADASNEHFRAIVDMGSNGIRFSISDLAPSTARIMPTIYQDRAAISLYDAQWSTTGTKQPIPSDTTANVVRALKRFKNTCQDFGVPHGNVRIVATEATRQAINSQEFRDELERATGWQVEMLAKEDEGRVGAMGVASSFSKVKGLMMDLGGGSTQLTWLIAQNGEVRMSEAGSVSMPYGAAALTRRLNDANKEGKKAVKALREEIVTSLKEAVQKINIPDELKVAAKGPEGLSLYLSGGGFRGWGFVLMSQHPVSPYPIPIINGFKSSKKNFYDTDKVAAAAASDEDIFRVSERRASQVPAVALLVTSLLDALPTITTVHFAQGGVREGSFYTALDPETKKQHPFTTATARYATSSTPFIRSLLALAIPNPPGNAKEVIEHITSNLLSALARSMYIHGSCNKDLQAAVALRSTTTGELVTVHGANHEERAMLALMLCERWGGKSALPPGEESFHTRLVALVGADASWWCLYFGRVAAVIAEVYPAGVVKEGDEKLAIKASWDGGKTLTVAIDFSNDPDGVVETEGVVKAMKKLKKLGKKKKWPVPGEGGWKIELAVASQAMGSEDESARSGEE